MATGREESFVLNFLTSRTTAQSNGVTAGVDFLDGAWSSRLPACVGAAFLLCSAIELISCVFSSTFLLPISVCGDDNYCELWKPTPVCAGTQTRCGDINSMFLNMTGSFPSDQVCLALLIS